MRTDSVPKTVSWEWICKTCDEEELYVDVVPSYGHMPIQFRPPNSDLEWVEVRRSFHHSEWFCSDRCLMAELERFTDRYVDHITTGPTFVTPCENVKKLMETYPEPVVGTTCYINDLEEMLTWDGKRWTTYRPTFL